MTLNLLFSKIKGGKGSGNFGHSGRFGKIGGSTSSSSLFSRAEVMRENYAKDKPFELEPLPTYFDEAWEGNSGKPSFKCRSAAAECHLNVLDYVKDNPKASLGVGKFIQPSKKNPDTMLYSGDHSWIFEGGKLKDPTIGHDKSLIYLGTEISRSKVLQILKIGNRADYAQAASSYGNNFGKGGLNKKQEKIYDILVGN